MAESLSSPDLDGNRGWTANWVRRDPVRAAAIVLILIGLAWRAEIASRGYLALDDFALAARALDTGLSADYVLTLFNNHLMPGGLAIYWGLTRWTGVDYWPYLVLAMIGQAVATIVFYRLLRRMLRPGWALLLPLAIFVFSPITLESTSWAVVAVNVVPMQLAMVWAMSALVGYVRTRRVRQLVSLFLALVFGLLFFEKSLLIVPLLFFMAACLYTEGGLFTSLWQAIRRYWPAWAVLGLTAAGYLAFYSSLASSSVREPSSLREVFSFLGQLFGTTLIPGILGGPWRWLPTGDGPPIADPGQLLVWISWAVMLALMIVTISLRRIAGRAWILLFIYAAMVAGLLSATRLGAMLSAWAGLVPRYLSDVVVVAALCVGVAVAGLARAENANTPDSDTPDGDTPDSDTPGGDTPDNSGRPAHPRSPLWRNQGVLGAAVVLGVLTALAAGIGTAWSGARYGDAWADKVGRDYLRTAQADLAVAPAGTVFFDELVPARVVEPYWFPDTLQSRFFRSAKGPQPTFVTEGENLSVFADDGHIRSAWVTGGRSITPGPAGCGWEINGSTPTTIPLDGPLIVWGWTLRIAYLSSTDTTATVRLGAVSREIPISAGLHQYFFLMEAGGESVELTLHDPAVSFCTNALAVGETVPGL